MPPDERLKDAVLSRKPPKAPSSGPTKGVRQQREESGVYVLGLMLDVSMVPRQPVPAPFTRFLPIRMEHLPTSFASESLREIPIQKGVSLNFFLLSFFLSF